MIEAAITPRTKAILPVHLHGLMADMDPIMEIARRHGLVVIEDAAQAHGAEYKGRRAGSIGDFGCFSFYPGKNLGAYGEGGAVVTNQPEFARRISLLRDWGQEVQIQSRRAGYNYRMDGIQGAVLNVKMNYIEAWTEARRSVASQYDRLLAKHPIADGRSRLRTAGTSITFMPLALPRRDEALKACRQPASASAFIIPCRSIFKRLMQVSVIGAGDFPITERLANQFLSLPIYAELRPEQVSEVVTELEKAVLAEAA